MHVASERDQTPFTDEQARFQQLVQQASLLIEEQTSTYWRSWASLALWPWFNFGHDRLQASPEARETFAAPREIDRTSHPRWVPHGNVVYVKFR